MNHCLVFPVVIPLLSAFILFALGAKINLFFLLFFSLSSLSSTLLLLKNTLTFGTMKYHIAGWGAPLGIDLYSDGLSIVWMLSSSIILFLIVLYSHSYWKSKEHPVKIKQAFYPLLFILWSGMNALFLSSDIFNLYVTLEVLTLTAVPMVALSDKRGALLASLRYLIVAVCGSLFYLLGVAFLYIGWGTLDISLLAQSIKPCPLSWGALGLMTVGLMTKAALFPFYFWLPPAHSQAPSPVSAILSGLVIKGPYYILIRFWNTIFLDIQNPLISYCLGLLGAIAILWGAFQALRQDRLKMLIAYSTVTQIGYLFLFFPLASGNRSVWEIAIVFALAHAFSKSALFLVAGNILCVYEKDTIAHLEGFPPCLNLSFFIFGLAGLSIMGIPPSGGFVGKWNIITILCKTGQIWWIPIIVTGTLLSYAYILRVVRYSFSPKQSQEDRKNPISFSMNLVALLLAAISFSMGFFFLPLLDLLSIGSPFGQ